MSHIDAMMAKLPHRWMFIAVRKSYSRRRMNPCSAASNSARVIISKSAGAIPSIPTATA